MNLVFEKSNEGPGRKVEDSEGLALRARERLPRAGSETGICGGYFHFFGKEKGQREGENLATGVGSRLNGYQIASCGEHP